MALRAFDALMPTRRRIRCTTVIEALGAAFNHNTTKFPLTGKHTSVACATCHVNGQYATLPTTCVSCHLPDYHVVRDKEQAGLGAEMR
jgi:hypothetical protein